jgi:double zinc ribbon protein
LLDELMSEMKCTNCGAENPAGLKFCEQCAAPFKKRCLRCGFENSPAARFCGECASALAVNAQAGSAQAPPAPPIAPQIRLTPEEPDSATLPEGERKTVTALFADIKGSTELMADLDPEGARRRQHRRSSGALYHNRCGSGRIHADRAYHRPCVADAGGNADRVDRGQ